MTDMSAPSSPSDHSDVEIPQRIPRKIEDSLLRKIPAVIHQTFETTHIPLGMYKAGMTWATLNPTFEYRFYTNDDRRAFIEKHFEPKVVAAYDKLIFGAARADLWRYCVLWVEGGVYADLDTVCKTDLREVIGPDEEFIAPNTGSGSTPFAAFTAFICTVPQHPFMKACIERATRQIHAAVEVDGYMDTGPGNFGISINQYLGRDEHHPQRAGVHEQGGLRYRIIEKVLPEDGPRCVMDGERIVFLTKYDGYLDDLKSTGMLHWADYIGKSSFLSRVERAVRRRIDWLFNRSS